MSRTPTRRDVVAAAATWIVVVVGLVLLPIVAAADPEAGDVPAAGAWAWWALLVGLTAQAGTVAFARAAPAVSTVAVAALAALVSVAGAGEAAPGLTSVAIVVVVFRAVSTAPPARLWWALVTAGVLEAVAVGVAGAGTGDLAVPALAAAAVAQGVGVVGFPLMLALFLSSRRQATEAQRSEARALVREQEARIETAIARERTAMARELHDIAAHHLSGIAVMLGAVDRQIETDPQAARAAVRDVRAQSRAVLDDLRRLVGLLRDDGTSHTAVETIEAIEGLAERFDESGGSARLEVLRDRDRPVPMAHGVGPLAQLAAYRMVQEALANARSHAPGADCRVEIDDRGPDTVVVTVTNEAPTAPGVGSGGGFGLRGMRERADLVGAQLDHGPTVDGGWRVRLTLPRDREMGETP